MKILLIISGSMLFLYVIKEPLKKTAKFVCDNFIGEIFLKLGEWIEPLISTFTKIRNEFSTRLSSARALGSIFIFLITVALCILNYHLIFYGMELLLPAEKGLGAFGFSPAGLASLVIMLAEVALGFLMLEVLGLTDLFEWHKWKKSTRLVVGLLLLFLFLLLVGVEIGTALKRIYEIEEIVGAPKTSFEKFMSGLPYWVTAFFTFVIPCLNALSAYSLRDILLLIGVLLIFTPLLIILCFLNIIHKRLYYFITHIDDFLESILELLTYPVELVVRWIVYLLIKLKIIKPFVIILSFSIFMSLGCSQNEVDDFQNHKVVVVLMDVSGSFNKYRSRAVEHCIKYMESPYVLGGGDVFLLFTITHESLTREKPPFVNLYLPLSPTKMEVRAFRAEKRKRIEEAKGRIMEIKKLRSSDSTDIVGGIIRASTIFNSKQFENYQKFLLIYSDMQHNVARKPFDINLKDVCVMILFADITEKTKGVIEGWKKKLFEFGAKEVTVYTPDDCEVQTDFGLKCGEVKR